MLTTWARDDVTELARESACADDDPALYDETDPDSTAARMALARCLTCPVRALCELVLLHEPNGRATTFTGVAAGRVWLNGAPVKAHHRQRPRPTPKDVRNADMTAWLRTEGDPDEIRAQHVRWNAGEKDELSLWGEQAYQRARARRKRAQL